MYWTKLDPIQIHCSETCRPHRQHFQSPSHAQKGSNPAFKWLPSCFVAATALRANHSSVYICSPISSSRR